MFSELTPVENIDVLISFLISNDVNHFLEIEKEFNSGDIKNFIEKQKSYYENLDPETLHSKIQDKYRLNRLLEHRWFIQEVPLKFVGTWPRVGDLPKKICGLSVTDACNQINELPKTLVSVNKIFAMKPFIYEIIDLLPPVLVMGGEIRDVIENQLLPFDADDGSHRCITAAMAGMDEIKCYVGLS